MRSVFAGVVALGVVACSSGSESMASTTVVTIAVTSTPAPAPVTSLPSTAPPPQTAPPPTGSVSLEAEIDAALQSYFDAYWECGRHPATCDPSSFTSDQGTARTNLIRFYADMASGGGTIERNGSTLRLLIVRVEADGVEAVACMADSGLVFGPTGPDGKPTLVNNRVVWKRVMYQLFKSGDPYFVGVERVLERQEGVTSC